MTKQDNGRTKKYWICDQCAALKNWVAPKWGVTQIEGLCGWCDSPTQQRLTPVVDFSGLNKKAVWD